MTNRHAGTTGVKAAAEGRAGDAIAGVLLNTVNSDPGDRVFQRVLVQEVLFDPAQLDDKRFDNIVKLYDLRNEDFLKAAPAGTIIGKRVIDSSTGSDAGSQYFFPFFSSHLELPVKAGEHVWVFFEPGKTKDYGFWITRIHEPRSIEDVNHTHADRKFHVASTVGTIDKFEGKTTKTPSFANGALVESNSDTKSLASTASTSGDVNAYEKILSDSDSSKVTDMEDVPRFKKRPGDFVVQGSNNTLIVLGTDRTGSSAEMNPDGTKGKVVRGRPTKDKRAKAGSIDVVVGRGQKPKTAPQTVNNSIGKTETHKDLTRENLQEGDPDLEFDLGRIFVSMKTDGDKNFNVQLKGISKEDEGPYAIIKVDHVRIIARKSIKYLLQPTMDAPESECAGVVIKDGNVIFIPSETGFIKLGGEDAAAAILCTPLAASGGGIVTAPPIVSTIGSTIGSGGPNGTFSKKVLIKA